MISLAQITNNQNVELDPKTLSQQMCIRDRAQDDETNQPFLDFMAVQLKKSLSLEIQKYKASHDKGFSFMF